MTTRNGEERIEEEASIFVAKLENPPKTHTRPTDVTVLTQNWSRFVQDFDSELESLHVTSRLLLPEASYASLMNSRYFSRIML